MIAGSPAIDGSAGASGDNSGDGSDSKSSAASVTVRSALRRLAIFSTLFSPARTTYSLPTRTIEYFFMCGPRQPPSHPCGYQVDTVRGGKKLRKA